MKNLSPSFVGLQTLKKRQKEQLELFEKWASENKWKNFHSAHYDWWMFPIDEPSRYGDAYTVYDEDIAELKKDPEYIRNYLRGAELVALSWGWDLFNKQYIQNPHPDQKWNNWPIRLYKMAKSLKLFGFEEYFESLKIFARDLMEKGESMEYCGRDLSWLFK